jgi:hypothetical protein
MYDGYIDLQKKILATVGCEGNTRHGWINSG